MKQKYPKLFTTPVNVKKVGKNCQYLSNCTQVHIALNLGISEY
jgi:hypothetical protein